jgi:signal transduction histidine kinase
MSRMMTSRAGAVALLVFVITASLSAALIWQLERARLREARAQVATLVTERAFAIQNNIDYSLSATYALAAIVRQGKGHVPEFVATATQMLPFYPGASSLQLAPDGIVAKIVPAAGNEKALGHNLLTDPARDKEAFRARDTGQLTLAGPFTLRQGGLAVAGRLPVFLPNQQGDATFWGFISIVIRVPDALETAQLSKLLERGLGYELWRIHPDTGQKQIMGSSDTPTLTDPVEHQVKVPNGNWTLSVSPVMGWSDVNGLLFKAALGLLFSLLLAWLAKLMMNTRTQEKSLATRVALRTQDLQRFAEVTAHHLQEPARRLASYAERLTTQLASHTINADTQLSLDFIGQQARHMKKLLRDTERYLSADQPRGDVGNTDTNATLQQVLDRQRTRIAHSGATLSVSALPSVHIDKARLVDLFDAALDNALQFASAADHPLRITVDGERQGVRVRLQVSDNGPGIDEEYRERVFRVFERLSTSGEGTGIGLALVRRIAESCGGRTWLEETPGGGCRLVFELPAETTS